jgi:hypothetical protein
MAGELRCVALRCGAWGWAEGAGRCRAVYALECLMRYLEVSLFAVTCPSRVSFAFR